MVHASSSDSGISIALDKKHSRVLKNCSCSRSEYSRDNSISEHEVHTVSRNPRKENITYIVMEKPTGIADILFPIVDDILENNRNAE